MFPFNIVVFLIGVFISIRVKSRQPLQYFFYMACVITLFDAIKLIGSLMGDYGIISSFISAGVAIPGLIYVDRKIPMFHEGD